MHIHIISMHLGACAQESSPNSQNLHSEIIHICVLSSWELLSTIVEAR